MTDSICITGVVATPPRHLVTAEGLAITSFRIASMQRRFNRSTGSWENGETNWYTVSSFRHLAMNQATSLTKGDRVIVCGRLRIREWENAERSGTHVEIEAEGVGHDLAWGTSTFTRSVRASMETADAATDESSDRRQVDAVDSDDEAGPAVAPPGAETVPASPASGSGRLLPDESAEPPFSDAAISPARSARADSALAGPAIAV